jgi:Alpha-kinase family
VYPVECRTWAQLLDQTAEQTQIVSSIGKEGNNFYLGKPLTSTLQLDLTASNVKKGGFKVAAFGTSMPGVFKAGCAEAICAKRTYNAVERVVEVDGSLTKKIVNVPHEGEKQLQNLTMEVSCLVWAQALLDIVYDFIKESSDLDPTKIPNSPQTFRIPQFRFVKSAIAIEQSSSTSVKKTTFLLEEVIDVNTEGPFRKYLNNVSPEPLVMEMKEDEERAEFLAFSQHVQYWKTKKQVFVSDYQGKQSITYDLLILTNRRSPMPGGNMLLSDPQISSAG